MKYRVPALTVFLCVCCFSIPAAHSNTAMDIDRERTRRPDIEGYRLGEERYRLEDRQRELLKALDDLKWADTDLQRRIEKLTREENEVYQTTRKVQHELNAIRLQLM